jgi:hypothetical protein
VEVRVASPEPAVGVFTPAGTLSRAPAVSLRDRLRRPRTEPGCRKVGQQSGSGEGSGHAVARSVRRCRPGSGDDDWGPRPRAGRDRRRRVARQGQAAWQRLGESGRGAAHAGMAATKDAEGAGSCRSIACSVNRFVNRTPRDSTRQRKRSRRSEMGSVLPPRSPRP